MIKAKIADLIFQIDTDTPYLLKLCRDYIISDTAEADIYIPNDRNYEKELASSPNCPEYMLESLHIYRSICTEITKHGGMLMHASAVVLDGAAYLFAAPSGTGKSTHTRLWCEYFSPERVYIINDDKPIIRKTDKFRVYGTPWSGKNRINRNTSAEIAGICLLKRGLENEIRQIKFSDAVAPLMSQLYRCSDAEYTNNMLTLLDELVSTHPLYELHCNISPEAVKVAYEGMNKRGSKNEN